MTRPAQDLEPHLAFKAIDEIACEQFTDTIFFHVMGEATLYPHLEEVVRYAKNKNLKVVLTTNGWGLSFELLGRILKAGVAHILFSVQTPDGNSFKLRRAAVNFSAYKEKICSLIARIIDNGSARVTLSFLTTPASFFILPTKKYSIICNKKRMMAYFVDWLDEIALSIQGKELRDRLCDKNKKELLIRRLSSFSLFGWNKINITERFTLETRVLGDWVHRGLLSEKMIKARIGYCEGLKTHFGILSNGDMVFCCADFDGKTRFGNIKKATIKDALGQKKAQTAALGFKRFLVKDPYCGRCLGDVSFVKSAARQLGSIFYFKAYRPWWGRRREKEEVLL
jgi:hypothetical protein